MCQVFLVQVTRRTPIQITLSNPLNEEHRTQAYLQEAINISPSINGKFEVVEDRTIIFVPDGMLAPGTQYHVTVKVDHFFKVKGDNRRFKFNFKTINPELGFLFNELDLDVTNNSDTIYEMKGSILLSDWEDSTVVHQLIGFDKPVNLRWNNEDEAKQFDFVIQVSDPKEHVIQLFTKKNNYGYPKEKLGEILIPNKNSFDVYSIDPIQGIEDYIQVTFTRDLDPDQDFTGLVKAGPTDDLTFSVEENKLRIWVQNKTLQERDVEIHDGIKSQKGEIFSTQNSSLKRYKKRIIFSNNYPNLKFIGNGGIIPLGGETKIPFAATNLRGIIVRVIKVYANNMGQFLQMNQLEGDTELARMGQLLCRKIIFLDERGDYNLQQENIFALDLKELITPEPGALYRVILSFNYELSDYPCPGDVKMTKQALIEQNKILEKEEIANFGQGSAYYYFNDQSWSNYNWQERNMPCKPSYYVNRQIAKNIISTNLGIIAKKGDRGKFFVSVNNILTGKPEKDVSVTIYDYQNQEIARRTTWDNGTAEIYLNSKTPFYIIARKEKDRSYLRLADGESLSTSSFDVAGEEVKKGIKGFIYTERGVWRPGDTIFVSFILNNMYGKLPAQHPVTFELFNPAGQSYWKKTVSTQEDNFYVFKPVTSQNAPTGVWLGKVTIGSVSFEKRLRIETIKPNRLTINLDFDQKILLRDQETNATLNVQWLTGATAQDLSYDINVTLAPIKTEFEKFKEYCFDDPTRKFNASDILFSKGKTDKNGSAKIQSKILQGGFAAGMLKAQFITKVFEQSGEFSLNAVQKIYSPFTSFVGIKSNAGNKQELKTGDKNRFDVVTLLPDGQPAPNRKLFVKVYQVEWYWWWNSDMGQIADYISSDYHKPITSFNIETTQNGISFFDLKIPNQKWGTYYIQINDIESGHQSGIMAFFDTDENSAYSLGGSDRAMLLEFAANKESYQPGEEVIIRFPSTDESRAIITIESSGGILAHHEIGCTKQETIFKFSATKEMQPNAYVSITLLNPYGSVKNDLPIRLYGVIPIYVIDPDSHLEPIIDAPQTVRPNSDLKIVVSEKTGYPMTFTLAVVDEGLLELTNFKTPSPWDAFFAKEALGIRTWDMYNYVLGAYGGKIQQIFSIGGDDALNKGPKAIVNRFKPVVQFRGPFTLTPKEKKKINIDIPDYVGKVRCMVIAGNNSEYGSAQKDVFVRQPVMILGTLPRQLAPGDIIWVPATVFAMEKQIGQVNVSIRSNKHFTVIGKPNQQVTFTKEGTQIVWFQLKVNEVTGTGEVWLSAMGKGEQANWNSEIAIVSPLNKLVKTEEKTLKPGETIKLNFKPFGIEGSNKSLLEISSMKPANLYQRLNYLYTYPYECLEQTISRAFPDLYMPNLSQFTKRELSAMEQSIRNTLLKLRDFQMPGGGFSYWPGGTSSDGWGSVYAYHFISQAECEGYVINESSRKTIATYQAQLAREWKGFDSPYLPSEQLTQAYRLYVLAINRIPEKGAMNRLKESKITSNEAKLFLAAAFAVIGRSVVAKSILESTNNLNNNTGWEYTFGSPLREKSIRLFVLNILNYTEAAHRLVNQIVEELGSTEQLNTQSVSFALMAVAYYYAIYPPTKEISFDLSINGKIQSVHSNKIIWDSILDIINQPKTIQITNKSKGVLYAKSIISGIPSQNDQFATSNGLSLERLFRTTDGAPIDVRFLTQETDFIFELQVRNKSGIHLRHVMIDQVIPAGWEIFNKRLMINNAGYPTGVTYQDYRDNQVLSYIPEFPAGQTVKIPIYVTTTYAGTYFMPASSCRCMYDSNYYATSIGENIEVTRE